MKNRPILRSTIWIFAGSLLVAGIALKPAGAQTVAQNQILQNKADEQDIRQHTSAVVTQVQALIDELAANGISGDDIKVLNSTKAALTNLSGPEMERVIASLQKAGDATTVQAGEKHVVSAYADQKGIILQFKQILKDYEQRQAAYELPLRFKELADRQTETLQTSVQVARETAGKNAAELTSMQQTTQQIVQADQDAINNEVALAQQQLTKAAQNGTDDTAKNMQAAQNDMKNGKLTKALNDASDALKAGQLLKAVAAQQIARDELHQVSKDLTPSANAVDALKDTAANIAKIIEEQKALLQQTNDAVDVKPRVTGLDSKQGVIVDETNTLQQDTQTLGTASAGLIKDAITPMQASRASLGSAAAGSFTKAATSQQDAISKLEAAEAQVKQDIAAAQKAQDDANKDPVAKLQDLQKQIQQMQQQQQQLTQQTQQALQQAATATPPDPTAAATAAQAQNQVQQQAQAAQQTAQPLSLPTSQALAQAANAMQQAQQTLTQPAANAQQAAQQAQQAQAQQQAAQQALAQANQQVAQQIAQAQQTPPDPNALQQAANALQQAQTDVSNAIAAAQPPQAGQPPQPDPGQPQAGQPQAGQPPQAGAPQAGAPPAGAQAAGGPPPPGGAGAGAPPPPGGAGAGAPPPGGAGAGAPPDPTMAQAAAALAQAAQDTAAAAATPGLPDAAKSAVNDAKNAIAQGQQDAAKNDAKGTAAAAADAQQALAQAQASVAIAQAGLAGSAPPPPGGAGGPPDSGPPGSGPPTGGPPMPGQPGQPGTDAATGLTGGSTDKGTLHNVDGKGKAVTFIARDRAAIEQTQTEKRPQEFAPMIDQYLKNLADQSSSSTP